MPDIIELDWKSIPRKISKFIKIELDKCKTNNIPITLPCVKNLSKNNFETGGFFDDDPLEFSVAVAGSYRSWLPIFVHETCHMDQWLENSPFWLTDNGNTDCVILFEKWMQHKIELKKSIKKQAVDALVALELDCEKRTVEKIEKYNLPIKIDTYIRKSNAYVWSYRLMQYTRNWEHSDALSYPIVWKKMPNHFDNDYNDIPDDIMSVFNKFITILSKSK